MDAPSTQVSPIPRLMSWQCVDLGLKHMGKVNSFFAVVSVSASIGLLGLYPCMRVPYTA